MSRKDYVALAAALHNAKPGVGAPEAAFAVWFACTAAVAAALSRDNERFDRDRFSAACGN
jgi:hypothetical protein